MRHTSILVVLVLVLAMSACASGGGATGGDTTEGDATGDSGVRTIEVEMRDNMYVPDTVEVAQGETVHLVFTNTGSVAHDAFIGDAAAQEAHEAQMASGDGGHDMAGDMEDEGGHDTASDEGGHDMDGDGGDEAGAITVGPGETGELTHTFAEGDGILIGCHEPGHYAAGMRLTVDVT